MSIRHLYISCSPFISSRPFFSGNLFCLKHKFLRSFIMPDSSFLVASHSVDPHVILSSPQVTQSSTVQVCPAEMFYLNDICRYFFY